MRILLAGQKRFGRDALELILGLGHQVVAVACPAAAEDKLFISVQNHGLPFIPAGALRAKLVPARVDLIVAAHSHDFIGAATRDRARLGAVGYHPSLLPLHRGRDAIRWAVKMGDQVTGGSIYWLSDTVDGGPIAAQDWCFIRPGDDARKLWARELAPMGLRLLHQALGDIAAGVIVRIEQDAALASWEPSLAGAPRLFRPELLRLGDAGFVAVTERRVGGL